MFLRLLFVLLIALNIAVGAWLVLGQDDVTVPSAADPGVPVLHLLTERPDLSAAGPAQGASAPADPSAADAVAIAASSPAPGRSTPLPVGGSTAASYQCLALGPFPSLQSLRSARERLAPELARSQSRQEQSQQSRGWWVYLPAQASRAQALAVAQRLADAHFSDYFVVSSGDQPNTISLGLFKDPANARKRREDLVAAGFPAQMTERVETVPEYWLDVVVPDANSATWRQRVRELAIGSHSTGCF
ncbi:SPOR domain-containing protein [Dyella ginsengisoli]|uniref:SPOR domain-containing protein n=1 Tax=Dyella ginsengisoli TaxID=363848 RepID=UPI0003454DA9|nr:SPOR domain-containing protein [Dyella ginsengisoli]